jgi:4-carboxymuconolactone decarboxylase
MWGWVWWWEDRDVRRTRKDEAMSGTAQEFYEGWAGKMTLAKAAHPELGKAFGPFFQALMKEGALTVKTKELIALGIAVATRCEPCIYTHTEKCVKNGATAAEVMEAAGVAVMMGGGPAYVYTPIVAGALKHLAESAERAGGAGGAGGGGGGVSGG